MSQPSQSQPCRGQHFDEFDFWIGEWDLTWPAEQMGGEPGATGSGTNRIERVLGGCVIEENFATAGGGFLGHSVSVFDPTSEIWRQTWVDNAGGYIALEGEFAGGRMELRTAPVERNGYLAVNRMVFGDITDDSLSWDWQGSRDGGETWTDLWNIAYRRQSG